MERQRQESLRARALASTKPADTTDGDKQKQRLERHQAKAEKLRKKLQKSEEKAAKLAAAAAAGSHHVTSTPYQNVAVLPSDVPAEASVGAEGPGSADPVVSSTQTISSSPSSLITRVVSQPSKLALGYSSSEDAGSIDDNGDSSDTSMSTSSDSSLSSDSSDDSSSPEEQSSKGQERPIRVPPLDRTAKMSVPDRLKAVSAYRDKGYGNQYLSKGLCSRKSCNYRHEYPLDFPQALLPPNKIRPKKVTEQHKEEKGRVRLFDRLMQQEKEQESMLILQAIKRLGASGFLN